MWADCTEPLTSALYHVWFAAALLEMHCFKWTYPDVSCHSRNAAVKVTALLTLRWRRPGVSPWLSEAVLCRSAKWEAAWTVATFATCCCDARCSERDVAVLCYLIRTFLWMSKQSTFDSKDTELFITETEQLPTFWDSKSPSCGNKQEKGLCMADIVQEVYWKLFFINKFSCATTQAQELPPEIPLHTGCPRRNVPDFGKVFLMLKYTDITKNTYVQSWTVTEIMAREVWNFHSCYTLIDYQIHIKTGRNMWFL